MFKHVKKNTMFTYLTRYYELYLENKMYTIMKTTQFIQKFTELTGQYFRNVFFLLHFFWVFIIFSCTKTVYSQNINYTPLITNADIINKVIDLTKPLGSVTGNASVSNSGASNYNIPIATPASTNGLSPAISINYNSLSGNGIVGYGWNIEGLSMISRSAKNMYYNNKVEPISLDTDDPLNLDGNPLVLLSGTNGVANSSYGTEMENFASIKAVSAGGSDIWFRVQTKEGNSLEFGNSADSRVVGANGRTLFWKVNKMSDNVGNYIEFKYVKVDFESFISEINFTGNLNAGLLPYNKLSFTYLNRNDKNKLYVGGETVKSNVLLNKIIVTAEGNTAFKTYQFFYGQDGMYSFLKELEETGSDGTKLNTTIFKYGDAPIDIQIEPSSIVAGTAVDMFTADYDGDGYSDILTSEVSIQNGVRFNTNIKVFKRTAQNNTLQQVYYQPLSLTSQVFQGQSINTKFFNFMSNDFNGDGQDDIIFSDLTISQNPAVRDLNFVRILYSDGGNNFLQQDYYAPNTFKRIHENYNYFFPGDFDGDGKSDFITFLNSATLGNKSFLTKPSLGQNNIEIQEPNCNGLTCIKESDKIFVVDFDGDGKQELMSIHQNNCKIFNIIPIPGNANGDYIFEDIYNQGFPTAGHDIFPGDFNGDRKTDLLTRTNGNWTISYSNGITFETQSFNFVQPVNYSGLYSDDKLTVADYNGDGKIDILHGYSVFVGGVAIDSKLDVYFSTGISFLHQQYYYPTVMDFIKPLSLDANGDGRSELIVRTGGYNQPFNIVYIKPNGKERLLEKVTTGVKHTSEFNYERLTNSTNFYIKGINPPLTLQNLNDQYPLNNIQFPLYCVNNFIVPDGIGSTNTTKYKYEVAKLHRSGKGFLGFEKMISENQILNIKTVQGYEINTAFYVPALLSTKTYLLNNNSLLSETNYSNQTIGLGNNRFITNVNTVDNFNALANYHTMTYNIYDNYGNIINQSIDINNIESQNTVTQYGMYGTPVPSKPTSITVNKVRNGAALVTKSSTFSYNVLGQVVTKTEFSGLPEQVNFNYLYDIFGNNTWSATSSSGNSHVYKSWKEYDIKGRFPLLISKYALPLLASETITESYTYDAKWGQPLTQISSDCQNTSFEYDGWGRKIKTTLPTGVIINNSFNWDIGNGAIGYSLVSHPGKPDKKAWVDLLGRKIKTETETWGGQWIKQLLTYDINGNLKTQSNTFLPSETPLISTYAYDAYNRVSNVSNLFGSTTTNYAYNNSELTITNTNPAGQVTKKTMDAVGKVVKSEDNGGKLLFQYDSWGNQIQVKHGSLVLITSTYNQYGRQTQLNDLNTGITNYNYNAFGQLLSQTDANNNTFTMEYDGLQRIKKRTGPEGITTYTYYFENDGICTKVNNNLTEIIDFMGNKNQYNYDNYNRLVDKKQTIDNVDYNSNYTYDIYGNLIKEIKPFGLEVQYQYDANGILKKVYNNNTNFFTASALNGLGQYKQYYLGNGALTQNTYYYGMPTNFQTPGIQDLTLQYDYQTGNILDRADGISGNSENFTYDNLNRLTSSQVTGQNVMNFNYDVGSITKGNIQHNDYVNGNYGYNSPQKHAVLLVDNPNSTTLPPDNMSTDVQDISYTPFQKINNITENGYQQAFTYNANYQRVKSELTQSGNILESKIYLDDCEILSVNGTTKVIYYIAGGDGLCTIIVKENGQDDYYYTYKDHLGSIVKVTDYAGNVIAEQNFDAWGRKRNPADWTYNNIPAIPDWLYRGFTQHEEMPQFSLINMNGRMYDPVIGRMLNSDNYVQAPFNTQSYNRYSYCINNPMSYTDPSGDVILEWLFGFIGGGGNGLGGRFAEGDRRVQNCYKIYGGLFQYDKSYSGRGDVWRDAWEVISRFTWQAPQTTVGFIYNNGVNLFGRANHVDYFHGATLITDNQKADGTAVTIGSFITLSGQDNEANVGIGIGSYTTMHEYGHYLQSKRNGFTYLFKYGLPSANGAEWTEHDANLRAANYFHKVNSSFTWDENYSNVPALYRTFPQNGQISNSRWYDYFFGIIQLGLISSYISNR
jgi:RHS repeat-associated protein